MTSYETIFEYVEKKFQHQGDKADVPYIHHLTRVASKIKSRKGKILALLHDVLEDTETTADEIRALGVDEEIVESLLLLTRDKNIPYEQYLQEINRNPLARTVKIADVEDNLDLNRLMKLPDETRERLIAKYTKAMGILTKK